MQGDARCRNCGAALHGRYCSDCGQARDTRVVTLWEFISDALDDLFSLDSRVWRTLLPLLFQPGRLTCEYLQGRRLRYLPPFRTYLLLSVSFFLLSSVVGVDWTVTMGDEPAHPEQLAEEIGRDLEPPVAPQSAGEAGEKSNPCDGEIDIGLGFVDSAAWESRFRSACKKIYADSGHSLIRALVDNIPMMMFLFIPVVALVMKLLYSLSRRKYVEHLLFLFHYHAFFFLVLILLALVSALATVLPALAWLATLSAFTVWIYIPLYLFFAMIRVYGQSRLVTTGKYLVLGLGYAATLSVAFAATVIYSVLTL